MNNVLKNNRGETLIETVVSISILVLILTAAATIIASSAKMVKIANESYNAFHEEIKRIDKENPDDMPDGTEVSAKCIIEFSIKNNESGGIDIPLSDYSINTTETIVITSRGLTYIK